MNLEKVRIDVESGALSNVKVAKIHGCSESHIRSLIKKHGWSSHRRRNSDNSHIKPTLAMQGDLIDIAAVRKFEEIKEELKDHITKSDEMLLVTLANNYSRYIRLEQEVSKEGEIIISQKGAPYLNPKFNALQSAAKTLTTLGKEFGLSIASRKRANINQKSDTEESSLFDMDLEDYESVDV